MPGTPARPAATQPLSQTVQQVWTGSLGLALAATKARAPGARGQEPASLTRTRPTQDDRTCAEASPVRSRGAPRVFADALTACARCQASRMREMHKVTETAAMAVRETRPNARVKPRCSG